MNDTVEGGLPASRRPPAAPAARPGPGPAAARFGAGPARAAGAQSGPGAAAPASVGNKLIVGREIRLKGEVSSCELLAIDGEVEAAVRCGELIVSESGALAGECVVTTADIAGRVEGSLTVTGRLTVRESGRIKGKIRYGEIAVEAGGELAGEIAAGAAAEPGTPAAAAPVSTPLAGADAVQE